MTEPSTQHKFILLQHPDDTSRDPTFGGYDDNENPWLTHWRWIAVREGSVIYDLRRLHRNEIKAGLPTGRCQCGLDAPCPTAEVIGVYTATLDDHCGCSRRVDGWCPRDGLRREQP